MEISRGIRPRPRRTLLYGPHGVGKSTWASEARRPLFIDIEGSTYDLDVARINHSELTTLDAIKSAIIMATNLDGFDSVVIDTIDWMERYILKEAARKHKAETFQEVGFARADGTLTESWHSLLGLLAQVQLAGKCVILLGHATIEKFTAPDGASYDHYLPKLHKKTVDLVQEWCDDVLFAQVRVLTSTVKEAFNNERQIAVATNERVIRVCDSGASSAKNRLKIKGDLPMSWAAYEAHWPRGVVAPQPEPELPAMAAPATGNIEGLVVNGSSKPQLTSDQQSSIEQAAEVF